MKIINEAKGKIPSVFFHPDVEDGDLKGYEFDIRSANYFKNKIIIIHIGNGDYTLDIPKGFTDIVIISENKTKYACFTKGFISTELRKIINFVWHLVNYNVFFIYEKEG